MPRKLTKEAVNEIVTNTSIYGRVCDALDVAPVSLPKLIARNSLRLSHYDVVLIVAKALGKDPELVLEKVEETVEA